MKLLSSAVYDSLVSEARETAAVRAAMAKLLTENEQLKAIAHQMTKRLNEGAPTISALTASYKAMARRANELAIQNVKLAHDAEQAELMAAGALEQSEQAIRVAKANGDKAEAADLLAETLEVVLDHPDRLEECGRNSLVAYRHLRLDSKESG